MPQAAYDRAVQSLYALGHELHHTPDTPRRKWELAHMRTLCAALGDPQQAFPSILIAGTNGKGSTAATLAAILQAAGLRTALYTSPHLVRVNERIQIFSGEMQGAEISDNDFARLYFHVDDTAQRLVREGALPHPPSFFEVMTALAFSYFAQQEPGQQVDIAILEVGLGGRLDATNIVEPLLSVITDIALDHTEYLGSTLTEIALEKAGILRENGTLVTLPQHPLANQAIGERAVALNVTGVNAAEYMPMRLAETRGTESADALFRNRYPLVVLGEEIAVDSPLAGSHQQRNIALAIAAAVTLSEQNNYAITAKNIADGIRNTRWPGRLETLSIQTMTGRKKILLDVAHNPAGVWALRSVLAHLPDDQPKTLIFSCLRDKALTEMAQILFPLFSGANDRILVPPIANPRAASVEEILAAADALNIHAKTVENVHLAVQNALKMTPPDGIIIATGSIYLIGAVRELLTQTGPVRSGDAK
jgi:dihydrofolate synthase/folylpolyglutamate synthase